MKYVKMLGLLAVAAAALMAFAGTASATYLTSPAGTTYTGTIHAKSEGTTTLHGEAFAVSCAASTVSGSVEFHSTGTGTAGGKITTLDFSECTFPVTVIANGSLEVHTKTASADGNGTLTSNGAKITIHGPFGINCLYETNNTDIGTLTGSKNTGKTATLDIDSSLIPRTGDSAFCGAAGEWTGSYEVTTPDYLDVD
ncbi:MAG TPA: hypothetical protein VFY75_01665 [Solirubrobacterales bacterium]|nr:hypothetical protein [Solirubrobacterales bacterium]